MKTEKIKLFQNPKELSHGALWHVILNVFTKNAPKELQDWYNEVVKEFDSRNVVLTPIMDCNYKH